ncbi:uncharacterized protein [Montipora capricornis]|uniref:uncharacterized protein isoform X1 n=1 Tax=Montipora capricornis TaxID=246305 RepID=UPI0035F1896C
MDGLSSLKVVVLPDLDDKVLSVDKKFFFPASTSVSCRSTYASAVLFDKQTSNGERIDSRKLTEEPKNANNKKQFSCPSIIDFNTLKFYQEIKPVHKPKRIFNGFFPSRVRSINAGLPCAYKEIHNVREVTLEELVPNPNTPPCRDGAVLSRTATNCSLRSEPITFPNESDPRLSPRLPSKQDTRRGVYSLRNSSPSPWVGRYKLKKKCISASSYVELKNKTSTPGKQPVRGFSS